MATTSIGALNVLNIGDAHVIAKSEPVMFPIFINVVMMNCRRWAMPIYAEAYPSIEITTPIKCQLLDYAEAAQVTVDTDPYEIPFLSDMKRPVVRVSFMNDLSIHGNGNGVLAPYVRHGHCACTGA